MGLDCTAYSKLKFVRPQSEAGWDDESGWDEGLTYIYMVGHHEHADGFQDGWYSYEDCYDWQAGSYGGYNQWREELSLLDLGVHPREVWEDFDRFRHLDVAWLVNFSDCEGFIGPVTSRRIYAGLRALVEFGDVGELDSWGRLGEWMKGAALASDGGGIKFH